MWNSCCFQVCSWFYFLQGLFQSPMHICSPRVSQACVNSLGLGYTPLCVYAASTTNLLAPATTATSGQQSQAVDVLLLLTCIRDVTSTRNTSGCSHYPLLQIRGSLQPRQKRCHSSWPAPWWAKTLGGIGVALGRTPQIPVALTQTSAVLQA